MEACVVGQEPTAEGAAPSTTLVCSDPVPLQSVLVIAHNMMYPMSNMDSSDILSDLQLLEKETKLTSITGGNMKVQNDLHGDVSSIFRPSMHSSKTPGVVPLSSIDYGTLISEVTGPDDGLLDGSVVSECTTIDSLSNIEDDSLLVESILSGALNCTPQQPTGTPTSSNGISRLEVLCRSLSMCSPQSIDTRPSLFESPTCSRRRFLTPPSGRPPYRSPATTPTARSTPSPSRKKSSTATSTKRRSPSPFRRPRYLAAAGAMTTPPAPPPPPPPPPPRGRQPSSSRAKATPTPRGPEQSDGQGEEENVASPSTVLTSAAVMLIGDADHAVHNRKTLPIRELSPNTMTMSTTSSNCKTTATTTTTTTSPPEANTPDGKSKIATSTAPTKTDAGTRSATPSKRSITPSRLFRGLRFGLTPSPKSLGRRNSYRRLSSGKSAPSPAHAIHHRTDNYPPTPKQQPQQQQRKPSPKAPSPSRRMFVI